VKSLCPASHGTGLNQPVNRWQGDSTSQNALSRLTSTGVFEVSPPWYCSHSFPQTISSQFKKLWRYLKPASAFCIYSVHTHVLIWGDSLCWPLSLSHPFSCLCVSCSAESRVHTKQSFQLISFTSHVTLWYSFFFSGLPAAFPYFPLCHKVERLAFFVNAVVCYCSRIHYCYTYVSVLSTFWSLVGTLS